MTFHLYDTEVGGSPLWEETQPSVRVDEGIFTTRLGRLRPNITPFWRPTKVRWCPR